MMSISEFLTGKNVFITGGSGFIGKALIELLLRCCPGIGNIYIMIREKKDKSIEERIREITDNPLFDLLKEQQPRAIDKIIPIFGDITETRLGISEEDEQLLISKVNIIYHAAASIRFDDLLRVAILTNVRSTIDLVSLAKKCQGLEMFAYISTSYSNTHVSLIEEKYYPSLVRWQDALALAEQDNPHLEALTLKYISPMPNTYTFSKSLAENAVVDTCKGKIPFVIIRPSIVVSSIKSPIPGWGDNLNGPFGLVIAGMKGILTICNGRIESSLDIVYVDNLVKACIITVWKECTKTKSAEISEILVYNITTDIRWHMKYFIEHIDTMNTNLPVTGRIWYGSGLTMSHRFYYIRFLVTHLIPALFIDALLKMTGRKPKLLKITRRIYIVNEVLSYFMNKTFVFVNKKYLELEKVLLECERETFEFNRLSENPTSKEIEDYSYSTIIGLKKYILHEPIPIHKTTYRNTHWLFCLNIFLKLVLIGCVLYLLIWKLDILTLVSKRIYRYFENL